mgnify:CR=1 FL=1
MALCGVAEHALMQLLNDAPHISQIALCLDHDKAGIQARERIKKNLSERGYHMVFSLFSNLKDWNEDSSRAEEATAGIYEQTADSYTDDVRGGE